MGGIGASSKANRIGVDGIRVNITKSIEVTIVGKFDFPPFLGVQMLIPDYFGQIAFLLFGIEQLLVQHFSGLAIDGVEIGNEVIFGEMDLRFPIVEV